MPAHMHISHPSYVHLNSRSFVSPNTLAVQAALRRNGLEDSNLIISLDYTKVSAPLTPRHIPSLILCSLASVLRSFFSRLTASMLISFLCAFQPLF